MRNWIAVLLLSMIPCSRYIPHMIRMYQNGKALHEQIWTSDSIYQPEAPLLLLTDWEDDGNGGASPLPRSLIQIGMAPLNMSYYITPSGERYSQLFKHEYTHIVMTDKYNRRDLNWRRFFGTKVDTDNKQPISALWSYLSVPRWYSPRWYHEGIACFMETWLGGGVGRALGGYDEMYFRSIINEGDKLYSVVGLETEGSTKDFQVGANAYLYGTRFVNYLTKTLLRQTVQEGLWTVAQKSMERLEGGREEASGRESSRHPPISYHRDQAADQRAAGICVAIRL